MSQSRKLSSEEREMCDQLLESVRELFRQRGRGSKKRVLEELGISNAGFDIAFKNGTVSIVMLARILKILEVDTGEFFSQNFPAKRRIPPGTPPRGVLEALQKIKVERGL